MRLLKTAAFALSMLASASVAQAERRCGWLDNPATGKWTLYDAERAWQIMFLGAGGKPAEGMNKIPDLTRGEYVHTFAIHGYACACMDVDTDEEAITRIHAVRQLPLSRCNRDPAIKYFLSTE